MKFVYPEFLAALALISIPIIVHLFNFRRFKKVLFTNVKFLKELKEETNSRLRLKHFLILLCRILAVCFLVFAFAQPFIPKTAGLVVGGEKAISVFVDNSFSMDAVGKEGTLLQQAISKAKEVALAYKPSDQFQLLTNDFTGSQQRLLSREEFIDQLQQLKATTQSHTIKEIVLRQSDALQNSAVKEKAAFIVSDFQKSLYQPDVLKADSVINFNLIKLTSNNQNNIFVDSVWLSSPVIIPGQPCEITVRVKNSGAADAENIPLKLVINKTSKAAATVSVASNSETEIKLNITFNESGWQQGEIQITDYPIAFDDAFFFSLYTEQNAKVLAINQNGKSDYLSRVYVDSGFFDLINTAVSQIDFGVMQQCRAVVLNNLKNISSGMSDELTKYVSNGGTLIVFPDSMFDADSYRAFCTAFNMDPFSTMNTTADKIEYIDLQSEIYKGVFEQLPQNMDVPVVSKHFDQTVVNSSGREIILKLQSGGSILSRYLYGKGNVYLFTIPLDKTFSNLVNHWLFAPTMYRMALLANPVYALSHTIGTDQSFKIDASTIAGEDIFHLINKSLNFDVIAKHQNNNGEVAVYFGDQIKQAGHYQLIMNNQLHGVAAMNYNRKESAMQSYSREELNEQIQKYNLVNYKTIEAMEGSFTKQLNEMNEGMRLWKYCIIFALLFLLAEVLLLKFWK